jgi:hypothetical protein
MLVRSKDLKFEKKGGSYKIGLQAMQIHHILYHQSMMRTMYLLQDLSMEMNC